MNIRETISQLTERNKRTHREKEIIQRVDWCSDKTHQFIQEYNLLNELGVSEENIDDQLILYGYIYKKVLGHQAKALEQLGKDEEVTYLNRAALKVDLGIKEKIKMNYQDPKANIRIKNIELAANFFFYLATADIQGQLGLNTDMDSDKWMLWRQAWSGKI